MSESGAPGGALCPAVDEAEADESVSATVLLVDDEEIVRRLVRDLLVDMEFEVIEASCAEEALEASASFTGRIDLLLTDLVMPGMGGRALAERLAVERPRTKVLYMSGFTEEPVGGLFAENSDFLQKPFTIAELVAKAQELLGLRLGAA
jgi:two-component system, cell cycle sensor histidine kinase and response regulator CckA